MIFGSHSQFRRLGSRLAGRNRYTQYYGLDPDYSAYSAEDCKANCCADPSCEVWQYTDTPITPVANCNHGVSYDYGDSGGIYWLGEDTRDDGPGGDGGGPSGKKSKKKKCRGVHCDDDDVTVYLIVFCALVGLYVVLGTYYGMAVQKKSGLDALPNANLWQEVGGLVKDGMAFTLSGGNTKGLQPYAAIPAATAYGIHAQQYAVGVAVQPGAVAVQPGAVGVAMPPVDVQSTQPQLSVRFAEAPPQTKKKKKVRVKREKSPRGKKVRPKTSDSASSLE